MEVNNHSEKVGPTNRKKIMHKDSDKLHLIITLFLWGNEYIDFESPKNMAGEKEMNFVLCRTLVGFL